MKSQNTEKPTTRTRKPKTATTPQKLGDFLNAVQCLPEHGR